MVESKINPVHDVNTACTYARVHQKTLLAALRRKELVGYQRAVNAKWRIYQSDLDAWIKGEVPAKVRTSA